MSSSTGSFVVRKDLKFTGLKVFSATMVADREQLGDKITAWLSAHRDIKPVEFVVTQSSDEAFHCVAITVFYAESDPRTK